MYTITQVSQKLGASASTLRSWERRYGIVVTMRSSGGYSLYDDSAVAILGAVQRLVEQGWSVREAVEQVRWSATGTEHAEGLAPITPPRGLTEAHPDTGVLLSAASTLSSGLLRDVLDRQFAAHDISVMLDDWLLPSLAALGSSWAQGRVSVAGEHLVSNAMLRRLGDVYESLPNASDAPRLLIGLPAHGRHELGLLAFAVAARASGLHTTYVGADLPASEWALMVDRSRPALVVFSASMPRDVPHLHEAVAAIREVSGHTLIAAGGAQQERSPHGVIRLGHRLDRAVELVTAVTADTARTTAG